MLRKVTAGKNWAGPDGVMYDTLGIAAGYQLRHLGQHDATATGTAALTRPLLYIFGDWMAAAPGGLDVVVNMGGAAKYNGGSDYSCAACHTAGWSNTSATAGLCNYSSKTTQASLRSRTSGDFGPGVWNPLSGVQRIGTPGICIWLSLGIHSLELPLAQPAHGTLKALLAEGVIMQRCRQ